MFAWRNPNVTPRPVPIVRARAGQAPPAAPATRSTPLLGSALAVLAGVGVVVWIRKKGAEQRLLEESAILEDEIADLEYQLEGQREERDERMASAMEHAYARAPLAVRWRGA